MAAGTAEIFLDRGASDRFSFELDQGNKRPVDLSGTDATLKIMSSWGAVPTLTLTSNPSAGLTLDTDKGIITVTITKAQTATLVNDVYYAHLDLDTGSEDPRYARLIIKIQG